MRFSVLVLLVLLTSILCWDLLLFLDLRDRTFPEMVKYLGAPYPSNATDIKLESNNANRSFYIKLRFKAPPDEAMAFARSMCNGVLYEEYNPFQSSIRTDKQQKPFLILEYYYAYYSYTTDANQHYLGNRCPFYKRERGVSGKPLFIAVDTSQDDLFEVRFEVGVYMNLLKQTPDVLHYNKTLADYITPLSSDYPFMVVGLGQKQSGEYYLITDQICFELRSKYYGIDAPSEQYLALAGSDVTIYLENTPIIEATISPSGTLHGQDYEPYGDRRDETYFHQCYYQASWDNGTYDVLVDIAGNEFAWSFVVE